MARRIDGTNPLVEDACPRCGALLSDADRLCPRCGADVTRDRSLHEPKPVPPEGGPSGLGRAHGSPEPLEPLESQDPEQRKPGYESGLRPPLPDED